MQSTMRLSRMTSRSGKQLHHNQGNAISKMTFTAAAITSGDLFDWGALMVVAAAVFFTMSKVRERRRGSRRSEFITRFKASRDGKRFYEDHMKGSDKDFPEGKP